MKSYWIASIFLSQWFYFFLLVSIPTTFALIFWLRRNKNRKKLAAQQTGEKDNGKTHLLGKRQLPYKLEFVFAAAAWLLWGFSAYTMSIKIVELLNYKGHHDATTANEFILEHFDVTGVFIGVIGIVVGLLIFIVVENNNEEKSIELTQQLDNLKTATTQIENNNVQQSEALNKLQNNNEAQSTALKELQDAISDVKNHLSALVMVKTLKERFEKIQSVIRHAHDNNNDLYVLSYAPNYGQFLMSNLKIIMEENTSVDKHNEAGTHKKFYKNFMKPLFDLKNQNKDALISYHDEQEKLHLAVLKSTYNCSNSYRFENFIWKQIIKDNEVLLFDRWKGDEPIRLPEMDDWRTTFVHEHEDGDLKDDQRRKALVDFLLEKDKKLYDSLRRAKELICLDYVPFQFFISVPESKKKENCQGIIIFTNYYDIGQDNGVVSFFTENHTLCNSMKEVFDELKSAQEEKDRKDDANHLRIIFKTDTANRIKIILKNIVVEKKPEFTTHGEVTTVADSKTKDALFALFKDNDIDYTSEVKFIKKDEVDDFLKDPAEKAFTFLSVGLFHNALSDRIGQLKEGQNGQMTESNKRSAGKLFRLISGEEADDGSVKPKVVDVAIGGNTKGSNAVQFYSIEETFSNNSNPAEIHKHDHAIFCKEKIDERWMLSCGGINYFASQNIVKCLTSNDWEKYKELLRDKEFIAVFKVNKGEPVYTELVLLTIVDEEGSIKNYLNRYQEQEILSV